MWIAWSLASAGTTQEDAVLLVAHRVARGWWDRID